MKAVALLALAVALEAGFLLTLAIPAPELARLEARLGRPAPMVRVAPPDPGRSSGDLGPPEAPSVKARARGLRDRTSRRPPAPPAPAAPAAPRRG